MLEENCLIISIALACMPICAGRCPWRAGMVAACASETLATSAKAIATSDEQGVGLHVLTFLFERR